MTSPYTQTLTRLLLDAEQSHRAAELQQGATAWEPYIAQHLHRALGAEFEVPDLAVALEEASAAYRRAGHDDSVRDEAWAAWCAERIAPALERAQRRRLLEEGGGEV